MLIQCEGQDGGLGVPTPGISPERKLKVFSSFDISKQAKPKEQIKLPEGTNGLFEEESSHSSLVNKYGGVLKQQVEPPMDVDENMDDKILFGACLDISQELAKNEETPHLGSTCTA